MDHQAAALDPNTTPDTAPDTTPVTRPSTAPDADLWTLDEGVRRLLTGVGVANIANALLGRGFRNVVLKGLRPLAPGQGQLVGPAYTLRFIPAREDLDTMANYSRDDNPHRVAIERCPPGAVLVIDAGGCLGASSMGDMMAARLAYRGVAGAVTDGGFRDTPAIRDIGLPCYQRDNAVPATPIMLHPLSLGEPIGCAGVAVYPGDVVVGDGDGAVVIPRHLVADVAAQAADAVAYEEWAAARIAEGRPILGLFPASVESRAEYDAWAARA